MINKILPGTTVKVEAGSREAQSSVSGVVAMALSLDWGAKLTRITKGSDTLETLGRRLESAEMKLVNEVMNHANELILYRLNSGTQASGELASGITAKAVYGGSLGNQIKVVVEKAGERWKVRTYLGTAEVDSQTVAAPADLVPNRFVTFEVAEETALSAKSVSLASGTDTAETGDDTDAFFAELEKLEYNVLCYTGTDTDLLARYTAFVGAQRAGETLIQAVFSGEGFDSSAIYNNTVGGKTASYELSAAEACATMAGILAKCGVEQSATGYSDVTGWTEVSPKLTRSQMEEKTLDGEILFVDQNGIRVLYDINSLTTFSAGQPEDFRKGLVMRTLDHYAADLRKLLDTRAVGKIRNSVGGRNQIKGMVFDMTVKNYLDPGYIEGFGADDIAVEEGDTRDSVKVTAGVRVTDTVDKIYLTIVSL